MDPTFPPPPTPAVRPPRPAPPLPGTPYQLLGRTEVHRWWRPLVGTVVVAAVAVPLMVLTGFVVTTVANALGQRGDGLTFTDQRWDMIAGFGIIGATLPATFLAARWVQRRRPGTMSSVDGRLRWGWLAECAGWALLVHVLLQGAVLASGGDWDSGTWPGWPMFASVAAIAVLLIPLQAAAEEYVFRGWLVQAFASWLRTPWPGAVLSSALFIGAHGYTDPDVLIELFVFAMVLCWITVRTGGIEAAVALHAVNNVAATLLTSGAPLPDQGTVELSWVDAIVAALPSVLYAWWVDHRFRAQDRLNRYAPSTDAA
ncbi:CPBP family intramembrane glutamic endopeptidase [Amycolatopsis suaedae]|uniref:CPBP family intramembrane metalloprotease n=1 Tax=Amycolatopsis suaedae TaxID=2510978 RepID=A0A4Q7JBL5_9PSEU|nr:CPBP family intramembrane glutamic endopeptidase [Amycolatopsis suaedae]RZQ64392.1 CPBP family intramembrane metalloprotease [Amycolatopsis suaedae]